MHPTLFRILAVLRPCPAMASDLLERIRALDEAAVPSLPTFYRHLRGGVDLGWLRICAAEDGNGTPGRPAHTYELTLSGMRALRAEAGRLRAFTRLAFQGRPERSGP